LPGTNFCYHKPLEGRGLKGDGGGVVVEGDGGVGVEPGALAAGVLGGFVEKLLEEGVAVELAAKVADDGVVTDGGELEGAVAVEAVADLFQKAGVEPGADAGGDAGAQLVRAGVEADADGVVSWAARSFGLVFGVPGGQGLAGLEEDLEAALDADPIGGADAGGGVGVGESQPLVEGGDAQALGVLPQGEAKGGVGWGRFYQAVAQGAQVQTRSAAQDDALAACMEVGDDGIGALCVACGGGGLVDGEGTVEVVGDLGSFFGGGFGGEQGQAVANLEGIAGDDLGPVSSGQIEGEGGLSRSRGPHHHPNRPFTLQTGHVRSMASTHKRFLMSDLGVVCSQSSRVSGMTRVPKGTAKAGLTPREGAMR